MSLEPLRWLHRSQARQRLERRSDPPLGPGLDVLDLEREVGLVAVGALAAPFLQQVLADLVAGELAHRPSGACPSAGTRCR